MRLGGYTWTAVSTYGVKRVEGGYAIVRKVGGRLVEVARGTASQVAAYMATKPGWFKRSKPAAKKASGTRTKTVRKSSARKASGTRTKTVRKSSAKTPPRKNGRFVSGTAAKGAKVRTKAPTKRKAPTKTKTARKAA